MWVRGRIWTYSVKCRSSFHMFQICWIKWYIAACWNQNSRTCRCAGQGLLFSPPLEIHWFEHVWAMETMETCIFERLCESFLTWGEQKCGTPEIQGFDMFESSFSCDVHKMDHRYTVPYKMTYNHQWPWRGVSLPIWQIWQICQSESEPGMRETFGSTCHGAGRALSCRT